MLEVKHGSMELPGFWRIVWFGKLEHVPSATTAAPSIKVYLQHLPRWPERTPGSRTTECINAGDIPLFHLNAVLHDGVVERLADNPWTRRKCLTLDLGRDNLRVIRRFDRDDQGDFIVPVTNDYLLSDSDANALFLCIGQGGNPFRYLIPCVEVFRFFYAFSSTLAKTALTGAFLTPDSHIWDVNKSWVNWDERMAFLQLRKRMLDNDARHLAIYAFVPGALERAREIFLAASGRDAGEPTRFVRALPPFDGRVTFQAQIRKRERAGCARTLITQLVSCDWRLPFDRIEYRRDNDGRPAKDPDPNRPISTWDRSRREVVSPPPNGITLVQGPGNKEETPWELNSEDINARFPEQERIVTIKLEREETETKSGRAEPSPLRPPASLGTTGEVRTSAESIAEALIAGLKQAILPEATIDTAVDLGAGDAAYLQTAELLLDMQRRHLAEVEFIRATPKIAHWKSVLLNVCPNDLGSDASAWLYVDQARTKPRLVLIASIHWEGRVRYLIDFQRKRPQECSMLVLWNEDEAELPVGYLCQALLTCHKARQVTLAGLEHLPITWGRLRHKTSLEGDGAADRFLVRLFEVACYKGLAE